MFDPYGVPLVGPGPWNRTDAAPTEHPRASAVLVLGALGVLCCGVYAPVAWVFGARALREIDESGGFYGGRAQVLVGLVLGIVGTVALVVGGVCFMLLAIGGRG